MESKLKQLKVAQLKELLTKAGVPYNKEVKGELIAKVLANPVALKLANGGEEKPAESSKINNSHDEDLLAPPEDIDWDGGSSTAPAIIQPHPEQPKAPLAPVTTITTPKPTQLVSQVKTESVKENSLTTTPPVSQPNTPPAPSTADEELERRKRRAERFGVPLQVPKEAKDNRDRRQTQAWAAKEKENKTEKQSIDDTGKLNARAARFGTQTTGQKRSAEVDPEEAARRQKRAERFGVNSSMLDTSNALNDPQATVTS